MWVNEKTESTNSSKLLISDGCKPFSGGKFMANYYRFEVQEMVGKWWWAVQ